MSSLKEAAAKYFGITDEHQKQSVEIRKHAKDIERALKQAGFRSFYSLFSECPTANVIKAQYYKDAPVIAEIDLLGRTTRFNQSREYSGNARRLQFLMPSEKETAVIQLLSYTGKVELPGFSDRGTSITPAYNDRKPTLLASCTWENTHEMWQKVVEFIDHNTDINLYRIAKPCHSSRQPT